MVLELKKFGTILNSRDFAREAILRARQVLNGSGDTAEILKLDFTGVEILTPSFADEFIRGMKTQYPKAKLVIEGVKDNPVLVEVLAFVEKQESK